MKRILLPILIITLLISCHTDKDEGNTSMLSVSILPQKYFVEQLAGELVDVNVMIPPGASPATYEPTVSQLSKLEQSNIYLRIGHIGFELAWMEKIRSVNPEMKVVDLSQGVDLILEKEEPELSQETSHSDGHDHSKGHSHHEGHSHGGVDPHLWLSVKNARVIAANLHKELLLLFPEQERELVDRLEQFNASLDSLHLTIQTKLEGLENRNFLIYHPALTYFSEEYLLHQHSLEIEGKSPSPAHLRKMVDLGLKQNISRILIQDQFDRKNAEVLAKEIDAEILPFDPLDPHWMEQMLYIADLFNSNSP